jgi:DNA polymerase-1
MFSAAAAFPDGKRMFWNRNFDSSFWDILADPTIDKVFHNAKFDMRMITITDHEIRGRIWDTMIFGHLLDGRDSRGSLNLDSMSRKYLPSEYRKVVSEVDQFFEKRGISKKSSRDFSLLPEDILKARVVGDVNLTLRLFARLYATVAKTFPLLLEQEHRLIPVIFEMENRGIVVDLEKVRQQQIEFDEIAEDADEFCKGVLNWDYFNINSGDHQLALLKTADLDKLIPEKTKTGRPKLSAFNLLQLHHPIAHMLLMGKTATKMSGTFLGQILDHNTDSVIHPSYNQTGTTTGRFSCSKPNLQNLPIEGGHRLTGTQAELDEVFEMTGRIHRPRIRSLYRVRPGYLHLHSDLDRAELVALGHYSNDAFLIEVLTRPDSDVHAELARHVFGDSDTDYKALRRRIKDMVYGVIYGAGDKRLATRTGGNILKARAMKKRLLDMIPGLSRWLAGLERQIAHRGYIETTHGRRHYFSRRESYKAVSGACQGTVGDEIKTRMVDVGEHFLASGLGKILLNVHDEIAAEIPIEAAEDAAIEMHKRMNRNAIKWRIPLRASLEVASESWGQLTSAEIGEDGRPYAIVDKQKVRLAEWANSQREAQERALISP